MVVRRYHVMTEKNKQKRFFFYVYRRNLPHWRLKGALYFVTWRVHRSQSILQPGEGDIVVSALWYFEGSRYELHAYVVMDDHVHVIVWPNDIPQYTVRLYDGMAFRGASIRNRLIR